MDHKKYEISGWRLTQQGGAVVVEGNGGSFTIPADQVADLIVGLLVTNPGPNPELIGTIEMARHFSVASESVANWFRAGIVPGAILAPYEARGGGIRNRHLMPKAALDQVERPKLGNPTFGRQK